MCRIIVVIFLSWFCLQAMGQEVSISRSSDIIVIRGKSYYLHTVEAGQTLYSICKAYGVDLEEVKMLNNKKEDQLSLYEVIKIPYVEPYVVKDDHFFYHKVTVGETLYAIARKYGIKPKRLLKYNNAYSHNEPLSVGAIVKLPLDEIDQAVIREMAEQTASREKTKMIPEEMNRDAAEVVTPQTSVRIEKEQAPAFVQDTLPIPALDSYSQGEDKKMPAYLSEVILPADPFVKIALLLPFSAQDYPVYVDSLAQYQQIDISARSEQFIGFYEGILLAVDSLKNQGYKIDLHVFDTERSTEKMYRITEQINLLKPDLIIGPVYGSVYKVIAENLQDKNIPIVYPLSSRSESFGLYPNFIQVNASLGGILAQMAMWLGSQSNQANIIHIDIKGGEEYSDLAEKSVFKGQLQQIGNIRFFQWDWETIPLDSLRTMLLPDRENILVLPTTKETSVSKILPILSALTDGYQITVLGLPEWQTFLSVDHETYYKLNTKLFTYSFIDYTAEPARLLTEKYRKYFYTEPHSLVYKAFDMGLYFIGLAARYRDRTLEALEYTPYNGDFSKFHFGKMLQGAGKENRGFYIVNFGSDYQLKVESF